MLLKGIVFFYCCVQLNNAIRYDRYTGEELKNDQLQAYTTSISLEKCTVDVRPCDESEWSRIDGSCNNLKKPTSGTAVPHTRRLPPLYHNGNQPRKALSGKDLELPRVIRTSLLCNGVSVNKYLTAAAPAFGIITFGDVGGVHDIKFFLDNKTDCCAGGRNEFICTPNIIPDDDPVHRFSGIRCMNLTRPLDFQYFGCTKDITPSPIEESTAAYDLSSIYSELPVRTNKGGELIVEVENGIIWPPSGKGYCPASSPGDKCFENYSNTLLPVQLFSIWLVRQHNHFAKELAKFNPKWDDNKLYYTARDINNAFVQQVHIYEWLSTLVGKVAAEQFGLASKSKGYRDIYDENLTPQITLEFALVNRWFHVIQNGIAKMFDTKGNVIFEHPVVNSTFDAGFLGEGKNILGLTQGLFRQPAAMANHGVHPDIGEFGLPKLQDATDIVTSDLHKNRLFGLRPYVDYVEYCFQQKIETFTELETRIDSQKVAILKDLYEDARDIDLLAGLWTEKIEKNAHIPPTLGCLLMDNILENIKGDRHWYERKNRVHALTSEQLHEIRKSSLASLLCTVGDGVTKVQKNAFLNINPKTNPLVSCDQIPKIDLSKWQETPEYE